MKYLIPVVCSLFLIGCSDTPSTETPPETPSVTAEQTVPEANETTQSPSEAVSTEAPAVEEPKAESVAPVTPPIETPKTAPAPVVKEEKAAVVATPPAAATVNGAMTFAQKCASCHGQNAEKSALGKSQVIAGWEAQKIKDALHGYQAGTYGKEMKALMQAQAKGLSDAQIEAIAKHVSGL